MMFCTCWTWLRWSQEVFQFVFFNEVLEGEGIEFACDEVLEGEGIEFACAEHCWMVKFGVDCLAH